MLRGAAKHPPTSPPAADEGAKAVSAKKPTTTKKTKTTPVKLTKPAREKEEGHPPRKLVGRGSAKNPASRKHKPPDDQEYQFVEEGLSDSWI
jgi:hypothetical protein